MTDRHTDHSRTQVAERFALRPATAADRGFLFGVYASTREEELAPVPWPAEQKEAFLRMQFEAQDRYYRHHYPTAEFDVILVDGEPAGRLYVDRWTDEIRVMDVALLPKARGRGVGTAILRDLLDEAAAVGKRLTIHVERFNRALRLYQRMGFRQVDVHGVYLLMEWSPAAAGDTALNEGKG